MAFGRRNVEEVVLEATEVWECTADGCKAWIRDNFKSEDVPQCPICKSEMRRATREIQAVANTSKRYI
ncbi:cold-shock protein [Bacillus sp. FJAT-27225]|uniref:cold-shock protein n=1 Tax=Bacillus sp. FJAT-27225 TaxID=1743144 RepID=UPI00080C2C91|nr:cold-shock protein [Bacillus sp. FJAT-27225]OCA90805.1 cold-shock protein [Bacillus sp. FJAT-27225]